MTTKSPVTAQPVDRPTRRKAVLMGFGLMAVGLSACAGVRSTPRDPNDPPFWQRNEQRDD